MLIRTLLFFIFCAQAISTEFDNDFNTAKAIVNSRIDFYTIRGDLLSGTDEDSTQFQHAICQQDGTSVHLMPSIMLPGTTESLFDIFREIASRKAQNSGETHNSKALLTNAQRTNEVCKQEWMLVLEKLESIEKHGTKYVTNADFAVLMKDNFSRRKMVAGIAGVMKGSETISNDMHNIASDYGDFSQICELLEPYLFDADIKLSKLKKSSERLKREFLQKKEENSRLQTFRDQGDLDALAAYITGEWPTEKKSKKKGKKEATSNVLIKSIPTSDAATESIKNEDRAECHLPVSLDTLSVTDSIMESKKKIDLSPIDSFAAISTESENIAAVEEDEFICNLDYFHYKQQKQLPTNNSKLARQRKREAGLALKTAALDISQTNETTGEMAPFRLKPTHLSTLQSILSVASHPPKWRQALSAISSVISQLGGAFTGSLGKGSAVEFWIGSVRFLVDSSHGTDSEMMYRDQMVFMKKGLERAGITLSLLNAL